MKPLSKPPLAKAAAAALLLLCTGLASPVAHAAVAEVEPNDSCEAAQSVGAASAGPITGSITSGDVDYFRVTATPQMLLQLDMKGSPSGVGTLGDPLLGVYDSACNQIGFDDDSGDGLEASVAITVPSDGVVILFALAAGGSTGSYQLSMAEAGNQLLSGKMLDAVTGKPLPADSQAQITLMQCTDPAATLCSAFVARSLPDAKGAYAFSVIGLPGGSYQLQGSAAGNYGNGHSTPFDFVPGSGDIKKNLKMSPLSPLFSDITPCAAVSPAGSCQFSYVVTNPLSKKIKVDIWALLKGTSPNGSPWGAAWSSARYTIGADKTRTPVQITLEPGASATVEQSFSVPAAVWTGSTGVLTLYASSRGNATLTSGHADAFGFTVTAAGSSGVIVGGAKLQERQLRTASLQAKRVASPAAVVSPQAVPRVRTISGSVVNADTSTPITTSNGLQLSRCVNADDQFCNEIAADTYADDAGNYSFDAHALAAGTYQVVAFGSGDGSNTFGLGYSAPFVYDGTRISGVLAKAPPLPAHISNVVPCADPQPQGGSCALSYTVTNDSLVEAKIDLWVQVESNNTGTTYGQSSFDMGFDGNAKPKKLTLQPGESRNLTQTLTLPSLLPVGADTSYYIWAAQQGNPLVPYGYRNGGAFLVTP
jgi:hypothetical protein